MPGGRRSLKCALAAGCALLACAFVASAQELPPTYLFAEVKDEREQPVSGATVVAYDEKGEERGSSGTNVDGYAPLFYVGRYPVRLIVRVMKAGYQTYEGVPEMTYLDGWRTTALVRIKLISKAKAAGGRRAQSSSPSKLRPAPNGKSPPKGYGFKRNVNGSHTSIKFIRGRPT
jgi:hypothetical protein